VKITVIHVNRILMVGALALGVFSVFVRDIDKLPIYLLLAYVFWRVR
jgi:hypothetical protein